MLKRVEVGVAAVIARISELRLDKQDGSDVVPQSPSSRRERIVAILPESKREGNQHPRENEVLQNHAGQPARLRDALRHLGASC